MNGSQVKPGIPIEELDYNINDPEFADRAADLMVELLAQTAPVADEAAVRP